VTQLKASETNDKGNKTTPPNDSPTRTGESKLNGFLSIMAKKLGLEHMSYYK